MLLDLSKIQQSIQAETQQIVTRLDKIIDLLEQLLDKDSA